MWQIIFERTSKFFFSTKLLVLETKYVLGWMLPPLHVFVLCKKGIVIKNDL
jgi:hypothetical protein